MKKLFLITAFIIFNITLFNCSAEDNVSDTKVYTKNNFTVEYTQIDYEILELINAHRIALDLETLQILDEASKEALAHNHYMIDEGTVSHDFFYIRSQNLVDTVAAKEVFENVGYGFFNAESIVNAWLSSEGHRENIENSNVTDLGVSTSRDDNGKYYFTNIFVKL